MISAGLLNLRGVATATLRIAGVSYCRIDAENTKDTVFFDGACTPPLQDPHFFPRFPAFQLMLWILAARNTAGFRRIVIEILSPTISPRRHKRAFRMIISQVRRCRIVRI